MPSLLPMPQGLNPAPPTGLPSVLTNPMQPTVSPSLDADTFKKLQAIVARSETQKETSDSGQVGDNRTLHSTPSTSMGADAQSGLPPALACLLASATSTPLSNPESSSQTSTPTSSLPPALAGLLSSTSADPPQPSTPTSTLPPALAGLLGSTSAQPPQPSTPTTLPPALSGLLGSTSDQPPQPSTPTSSLPPALAALLPSNLPRLSPAPSGRVNTSLASDLSPPVLEKVDSQPYMSCSHTDMTRQDESQDELETQDSLPSDREPSENTDHPQATIRETTLNVSEQDIAEKISMERLKSESMKGGKFVEEPQRKIPIVPKKKKPTYEGISDSQRMAAYITYSQKSDLEEKLAQKVPKKKSWKIKRHRMVEEMYEGMEYYEGEADRFGYDPSVEAHFMENSSVKVGKEGVPQDVSSSQEVEKEGVSTREKNENSSQEIEKANSRVEVEKKSSPLEEENENIPPIIKKEESPEEKLEKEGNSSQKIEIENSGEIREENGSSPQEEEKNKEPSQEEENEEELSDVEEGGIWLRLDGSPRRADEKETSTEEKEKSTGSLPEVSPYGKEKQMSDSDAVQNKASDKNAEISRSEKRADGASDADEEIVPDGSGEQAELPGGEIQTESDKEMPDKTQEPENSTKPDNVSQPETEQTSQHSTEKKINSEAIEKENSSGVESRESPDIHSETQANSAVEEEAKMDTDIGKGDSLPLEASTKINVGESENASSRSKVGDPSNIENEGKMEGASQTEGKRDNLDDSQEKVTQAQGKMDKENMDSRENQSEMTLESHGALCDNISDSQIEGEATPTLEATPSVSGVSGETEVCRKDTDPIVDQEGSSGHIQKDQEQTLSSQPRREDSRTTKPKCILTQIPSTVPVVLPKTAVRKSKLQGILNATTKPPVKIQKIQADANKVRKFPLCHGELGLNDPHYYEQLDPRLEKWDNDKSVYSVGFQMEGVNLNVPQFTDTEYIKVIANYGIINFFKKDEHSAKKEGQKIERRRDSREENKESVKGKPKSKVKNLLDIRPDPRIAKKCKQTVGKKLDSTKKSENSSTDRAKNSTLAVAEKSISPSESAESRGVTTLRPEKSESSAANTDSVAEVLYFMFAHNSFTLLD